MADGIYWTASLPVTGVPPPARVMNVSFNCVGPCPVSVQQAITAARAKGTVIVVAAGNFNQDIASTQPGNCKSVITVTTTDTDGNRAAYSTIMAMA
jgi:serine protease